MALQGLVLELDYKETLLEETHRFSCGPPEKVNNTTNNTVDMLITLTV